MANVFPILVPGTLSLACLSRSLGVLLPRQGWGTDYIPVTWRHHLPPGVGTPSTVPHTLHSPFPHPPRTRGPCRNPYASKPSTPHHPMTPYPSPRPHTSRPPEKPVLSPRALQLSPSGELPRRPGTPGPAFLPTPQSTNGAPLTATSAGRRADRTSGRQWARRCSHRTGRRAGSFRRAARANCQSPGRGRPRSSLRRRRAARERRHVTDSAAARAQRSPRCGGLSGSLQAGAGDCAQRSPVGRCYGRSQEPRFLDLLKTRVLSRARRGWGGRPASSWVGDLVILGVVVVVVGSSGRESGNMAWFWLLPRPECPHL